MPRLRLLLFWVFLLLFSGQCSCQPLFSDVSALTSTVIECSKCSYNFALLSAAEKAKSILEIVNQMRGHYRAELGKLAKFNFDDFKTITMEEHWQLAKAYVNARAQIKDPRSGPQASRREFRVSPKYRATRSLQRAQAGDSSLWGLLSLLIRSLLAAVSELQTLCG